jgi:hypothetical protein
VVDGFPEAIKATFPYDGADLHRAPDPQQPRLRATTPHVHRISDIVSTLNGVADPSFGYDSNGNIATSSPKPD